MRKSVKLLGFVVLLLALVVACGKKKEQKEELEKAIEKADKLIEDNLKGPLIRFPDIKAERDEIVEDLDEAKEVLEDEDGDYEAALKDVNEAIKSLEELVEAKEVAKEEMKGMGGRGERGSMRGTLKNQQAEGQELGGEGAAAEGGEAGASSEQTTTVKKSGGKMGGGAKKGPGGRLPRNQ